MKSTPFNPETDIAPIPFTDEVCHLAKQLKEKNLKWQPHVGCFVWDELRLVEAASPFPHRIYFILNLGHFLRRFQTTRNIANRLVWLPTWHQALEIYKQLNIPHEKLVNALRKKDPRESEMLVSLYQIILEHM